MTALLRIKELCVQYGRDVALSHVTLEVERGEVLAIIGESGSGKTTLALALAGLLPDNAHLAGQIEWPDLAGQPEPGRDIGFVFQDPAASLDPLMRVGQQLVEVIRTHEAVQKSAARERAIALLRSVHIPDPEKSFSRYPHQFSGGQQQRIAIALAVAANPYLLIADEATSALDTIVQKEIIGLLMQLVRERGMALLFITHDIALAASFADRIAVFRHGSLVETGPAGALIKQPKTDYTRTLIGAVPRLEGRDG